MNEQYTPGEVHEPVQESRYAWLRGFRDIFFAPSNVGNLVIGHPGRALVLAVLLWALVATGSEYLRASHSGLVHQNNVIEENDLRAIGRYARMDEDIINEQIQDLRTKKANNTFQLPGTLAWSVVFGFFSLMVLTTVYWILVRLFNSEPPSYSSLLAVVSYGNAIAAVGLIVVAVCQYVSGSIFVSPSLAFLTAPLDRTHTLVHTLLSKFNIFTLWEYAAVGIAVAIHSRMSKKTGIVFGSVAFLFLYGIYSVILFLFLSTIRY